MYFKDVPFPPVIRATVVVMVGVLLGVEPHAESVVSARSVVVRRITGWL